MPLKYKKKINQDVLLGIWEITESENELLRNINLKEKEKDFFKSLKNSTRRKHWLSYRNIINSFLKNNDTEIYYDENLKPHFLNLDYNFSVSHSGDFAAVILSKKNKVGIDIEQINPRVKKVITKFLNDYEIKNFNSEENISIEKLYVYWCAKESLLKLYGKKNLDFKKNIIIQDFDYNKNTDINLLSGEIKADFKAGDYKGEYILNYTKLINYMLVYVVEN
ncbi:MAG: 4'-phosphopantetheinyl transferase superfamily protein [Bacteroidales bacterium]|nr:4'-phosphopantetheinyl transferase superfamily protein [Bacteroidales bacterium]